MPAKTHSVNAFTRLAGDEGPALHRLFEDVDGLPIPRLPRDVHGVPRFPNGRQFLSVEQAADHFRVPAESLDALWANVWNDLITTIDFALLYGETGQTTAGGAR